jgi:hypothetical protein
MKRYIGSGSEARSQAAILSRAWARQREVLAATGHAMATKNEMLTALDKIALEAGLSIEDASPARADGTLAVNAK